MPGDDVERGVIDARAKEASGELCDQLVRSLRVLVARLRREEIARIGESVGADRAEVGELERRPEVLANVAADRTGRSVDAKAQSARNHRDLLGFDADAAELRVDSQRPELRDDQPFPVRAVEEAFAHRLIRGVQVDAASRVRVR